MEKTLELELRNALKKGCPRTNSCNYPVSFGDFAEKIQFVREYCGNGKHNQCPAIQEQYVVAVRPAHAVQEKKSEERRKNGFFNSISRAVFDFYKGNHGLVYR